MLYKRLFLALALLAGVIGRAPAGVSAQDQGVAVITSPLPGAALTGLVSIIGTATHGQFERYELAFAYSPNPTDTWFAIETSGTAPIANDILARWDTSVVSDGVYMLRLRVYSSPDAFLESLVPDVRLVNATPTAPPSLPDVPATPLPTATEALIVLPPTATPRPTVTPVPVPGELGGGPAVAEPAASINARGVAAAFAAGARLTLIGFLLLAAYASLRAMVRTRPRR